MSLTATLVWKTANGGPGRSGKTGGRRGCLVFGRLFLYMLTKPLVLLSCIGMARTSKAVTQLPPTTQASIERLGADLAVARLRRKESLQSWSRRMGVSVGTLLRLEAGDPSVGIGIVATALWLIQRDSALGSLASPEGDLGAIEQDVREATKVGRARARASAEARTARSKAGS